MKNDFEKTVENLSAKIGEEQAKEFDQYTLNEEELAELYNDMLDEALYNRNESDGNFFLGHCVDFDFAYNHYMEKKKRKISSHALIILTMLFVFLLFTGGATLYYRTYTVQDMGNYGIVQSNLSEYKFHQEIVFPTGYILSSQEDNQNSSTKAVYTKDDDVVIFIESKQELQIDTEYVKIESRILSTGYEALFYEKNGRHILWQQDGYFYYLYTSDLEVDIVVMASSLHKP